MRRGLQHGNGSGGGGDYRLPIYGLENEGRPPTSDVARQTVCKVIADTKHAFGKQDKEAEGKGGEGETTSAHVGSCRGTTTSLSVASKSKDLAPKLASSKPSVFFI